MEDSLPTEAGGLKMMPSRENPRQSYRADQSAYTWLKPYGIVCRVFGTRHTAIDTTVVAGNSLDTFHNPESCFPLYGWNVVGWKTTTCPTKSHGVVPMRILRLTTPMGERLAAFCYKSPDGMCATRDELVWRWVKSELKGDGAQEGAFYRFIALKGPTSEKELLAFVADYLDRANDESGGVL